MKKLTLISAAILGLSISFVAPNALAKTNEIAVIVKSENSNFWQNVKKGALKAGEDLGGKYKISFQGPQAETAIDDEVNMVKNAVNRDVAGIVLAASDPNALIKPVKEAWEHHIPVVIIDSGINSNGKYYQSYLATDNYEAGKLAAKKLLTSLKGKEGEVGVMSYTPGSDSAIKRTSGFIDEVKKVKGMKVLETRYSQSDMALALNQTTDVLASHPKLVAIFGANEPTAVGMARAIKEKGYAGKIVAVGFDGNKALQDFVRDGTLNGIVVQSSYSMGYKGVNTISRILNKEKVNKFIDTGVVYVTKDNIDSPEAQAVLY